MTSNIFSTYLEADDVLADILSVDFLPPPKSFRPSIECSWIAVEISQNVSWPSNVATATSFPSGLVVNATTKKKHRFLLRTNLVFTKVVRFQMFHIVPV